MKKLAMFGLLLIALSTYAQETAHRFFYELSYQPKKDSARVERVLTILDITPTKSIYQDYTVVSQDSIVKASVEAMQKSGTFKDVSKSTKKAKFPEKIYKFYPEMKLQYSEPIMNGLTPTKIAYEETLKWDWKLSPETQKIGGYNTQKATTSFGGRQWTAWFSTELPFIDGPYKFSGLPGLIIKIEDDAKHYTWTLVGNKKLSPYSEYTYIEELLGGKNQKIQVLTKEKFEKVLADYKKDPFASMRPMLTPEMLNNKLPGSDETIGQIMKRGEKELLDYYKANDNPIELKKQPQ